MFRPSKLCSKREFDCPHRHVIAASRNPIELQDELGFEPRGTFVEFSAVVLKERLRRDPEEFGEF